MDARQRAQSGADERLLLRTAKACGPGTPRLVPSWRRCLRIAPMTVTIKSGSPGRARRTPLKPSRREGPADPAVPVVTTRVLFVAREAMGAAGTRSSLRPPFTRAAFSQNSGARRSETADVRHVVARSVSDEATQTVVAKKSWIASRSLSSGRASRGPVGSQ